MLIYTILAGDMLLVVGFVVWFTVIRPARKRDIRRMIEAMQAQTAEDDTIEDPTEITLAVAGLEGQRVCPICKVEAPGEVDEDHGPMWLVAHFMTHDTDNTEAD